MAGMRWRAAKENNVVAPVIEKRIGGTEKRADSLLHHVCKCGVKLTFAAGVKNNNLSSERGGCRLRGCDFDLTVRVVRIHEESGDGSLWHKVMQQLQSLGDRRRAKYGDAGSIAAGSAEAVYQAFLYRVPKHAEHYWNRLSGCLGNLWRWIAPTCDNYGDLSAYQIGR
jgi:hypothetical protein